MAETTEYMLLGIASIVVIMGGLVASLTLRWRNLKRDLKTIEELER